MAKLVFFGTPDYVIPVLKAIKVAGHEIVAVVTQPPKPVGRKQEVTPSPVGQWAEKHGTEVLEGEPKELVEPLVKLGAEVGVLEAYGRILPPELLGVFPHGIINVHPSLLPRWRGASPVAAAIAAGDRQTGVTIIKLDAELDHGPILAQFIEDIKETDTRGSLRERLFRQAAKVLVTVLPKYLEGKIEPREQDHNKATYTTLIKKEHGFIPPKYLEAALKGEEVKEKWNVGFIKDYSLLPNPYSLERFIRALDPWPNAWTSVRLNSKLTTKNSKRLKILKAHLHQSPATNHQSLVLDLVQLEGKNPVSFKQLLEGYPHLAFD